jgi:hypothetical protein
VSPGEGYWSHNKVDDLFLIAGILNRKGNQVAFFLYRQCIMLKRVLKPGDTHLMSADEEYCCIVHERRWNTPDLFNLSVELYDKGGVRVRQNFTKITSSEEATLLQGTLGDGWEPIFRQDYTDWSICCQKRPRTTEKVQYLSSKSSSKDSNGFLRNALVGAVGVGVLALVIGGLLSQQPEWLTADTSSSLRDSSDSSNSNDLSDDLALSDENLDATLDASDSSLEDTDVEVEVDLRNDDTDDSQTIGDALFDDDLLSGEVDRDDDGGALPDATSDSSTEKEEEENVATLAIANDTPRADNDPDPFVAAVRIAQAAVIEGRVADTREEWLDLADEWQQAADLMADVSRDDDRYDIAQSRIELYENNRDVAESEAEKAD